MKGRLLGTAVGVPGQMGRDAAVRLLEYALSEAMAGRVEAVGLVLIPGPGKYSAKFSAELGFHLGELRAGAEALKSALGSVRERPKASILRVGAQ